MLEDILEGNYNNEDIPTAFDAKYALALSLRNATIEQIKQVREFICKNLGAEILAMFDVAWVGNDNEKAIYLAGLPTLQELPSSNPNVTELTPNLDEEDFKASIRNAVNTWKNYLKNHPNMEK